MFWSSLTNFGVALNYMPGQESITEDVLLVAALAQASLVSVQNFAAVPYLQHIIVERSDEVLIEKLLAMSIKLRFLDDRTNLLELHDRNLLTLGKYFEDDLRTLDGICIRMALNKLVHHQTIRVYVEDWGAFIVDAGSSPFPGAKLIPLGPISSKRVTICVEGKYQLRRWRFEIDLFLLLNEVIRTFESANARVEVI